MIENQNFFTKLPCDAGAEQSCRTTTDHNYIPNHAVLSVFRAR
jgi:hypothetical protein